MFVWLKEKCLQRLCLGIFFLNIVASNENELGVELRDIIAKECTNLRLNWTNISTRIYEKIIENVKCLRVIL